MVLYTKNKAHFDLLEGLGDGVDLVAHDDVVVEVGAGPELAHVAQAVRGLENAANLRVIICYC